MQIKFLTSELIKKICFYFL